MPASDQTVVARLTPSGRAALATLGILGPSAASIADQLFRSQSGRKLANAPTNRHWYGQFGASLEDDVVARLARRDPVEEVHIHGHGGPALVRALLDAISSLGALEVSAWEYLARAGLSEVQIEAARALAECSTARAAAILLDQYQGALDRELTDIAAGANGWRERTRTLLERSRIGLRLVSGWRVAFVGPTNAGKSSLVNALAGYERAIVTDIPGTTRDVLSTAIALEGWPVELLDGPGFRSDANEIERAGHANMKAALASVDLLVLVQDTSRPVDASAREWLIVRKPDFVVGTKADLVAAWSQAELAGLDRRVSARTEAGVRELGVEIAARLIPDSLQIGAPVPFTPRQVTWLHSRLAEWETGKQASR